MDQMSKTILLVEDNPDDAKLTLRAFKRNNMLNPVVVARARGEGRHIRSARAAQADGAGKPLPTLIILDLNPPKLVCRGVLKAVRGAECPWLITFVLLTSS